MSKPPILVSACLLGLRTRYDGTDAVNDDVKKLLKDTMAIAVCPEQLGGLPTPRPRAEISGKIGSGKDVLARRCAVTNELGQDVTENFLLGSEMVLNLARLSGAKQAFFKERSPSCGVKSICRNRLSVPGQGVTTALLATEGIEVLGFK